MHCTVSEMARYKGTQASHLYEKLMHTLCTVNEQPLQAKASTILDTNTLLYSTGALESFTCSGMTLPLYMGPTAFTWYLSHERYTVSNVESQDFTPYTFGSTARNWTPDLCTTRPTCLTTRPRLSDYTVQFTFLHYFANDAKEIPSRILIHHQI